MKSVVCPELSTAAAGSSQAPTAAVDNSAPSSTHPEPTYKSGKAVQITGTSSIRTSKCGSSAAAMTVLALKPSTPASSRM